MYPDDPPENGKGEADSSSEALLRRYSAEIKRQLAIPFVRPLPRFLTPARQWALGAVIIVALCAVEGWLLAASLRANAPPPISSVLAVEGDTCSQRQAAIMRALAAHKRAHKTWPPTLDLLGAPYLHGRAVDPASGRPYEFTSRGDAVVVACPNPWLHGFPRSESQESPG